MIYYITNNGTMLYRVNQGINKAWYRLSFGWEESTLDPNGYWEQELFNDKYLATKQDVKKWFKVNYPGIKPEL